MSCFIRFAIELKLLPRSNSAEPFDRSTRDSKSPSPKAEADFLSRSKSRQKGTDHGGKDYDSRFESRMKGTGIFSELYRKRFKIARDRLGYRETPTMDKHLFQKPSLNGQMSLF